MGQSMPPEKALPHWQVDLVQSPIGSLLLSSGSWCMQNFVCALQDWSLCFFQSCGSLTIKSCWPQDQIPWRFPVPLSDAQAGKPDVGFRTFTAGQELLWYYCSPVCGSPTWWLWDLILLWLHTPTMSLQLLICLWMWDIFFWWVPASFCQWLFNS